MAELCIGWGVEDKHLGENLRRNLHLIYEQDFLTKQFLKEIS